MAGTSPDTRMGRRRFLSLSGRAVLLGSGAVAAAAACGTPTTPGGTAASDRLFRAGRFAEADQGYATALAHDPHDAHALIQRGYVALLSNRLAQAQELLGRSIQVGPGDQQAQRLLALAYYRADDFARAAPVYAKAGQQAQAQLLDSFQGRTPYDLQGPDTSRLPFLRTDPLPLVEVAVNGSPPVPAVLDTGAPDIVLNRDLAQRAGVPSFGTMHGFSAGGTRMAAQLVRVDSVTLGGFQVRNVPGMSGPADAGMRAPDGRQVEAVVGNRLFSHFLTTLDYPAAALVLRRKTQALLQEFEGQARAASAAVVPFWMYGDHMMAATGTVNGHGPMLFTVDTGGTIGFAAPTSTANEVGIRVDTSRAVQGHGSGGGTFTAYPVQVTEVTLGSVVRRNVRGSVSDRGSAGPSPGFDIGGTVSHLFFRPSALTIDTVGMRLFVANGDNG